MRPSLLCTLLFAFAAAAVADTAVPAVAEAVTDATVVEETIGTLPVEKGKAVRAPAEEKPQADDEVVPPPRLTTDQMKAFEPTVLRKRKGIIAGSAIMLSAALIDYALVVPAERGIDPEDIEDSDDSFALLNPQLLVFGLRCAGPAMSCMRATEVADAYERITGVEAPKNRSWLIYFCGWGLYVASTSIAYLDLMDDSDANWQNVAFGVGIGTDLVWVATCVYSYLYLKKLGSYTEDAQESRAMVHPTVTSTGAPGLGLTLRF